MARQTINIGTVANDGTGDDLRVAMQKVNDNFTELYGASPYGQQITISGNEISSNASNANIKLTASGTGFIEMEGVQIRDNHIESNRSNDDLILGASGTGNVIIEAIRINGTTLSSDNSTVITVADTLDASGGLVVSNISSNDSAQVVINDGMLIEGDLNVTGTIIASSLPGVNFTLYSDISDGTITHTGSSGQQRLDVFNASTYRSAKYVVSISDSTNSRYAIDEVYVTHDGTNAYISSITTSSTGSALVTYSADISDLNVRVLMIPISSDSVTYKYVRTAIDI
jgi:hypothetical protein